MARMATGWLLGLLLITSAPFAQDESRKRVVNCAPVDSTTFFYTNKTTAFYFGEACGPNSSAMQGLNVLTQEFFEDYVLRFDGNILDRSSAEVLIYPDRVIRKYSPQQITEEVVLLDSLNVLTINITSQVQGSLEMIPGFSGSRRAQDFELRWEREFGMLHVGSLVSTQQGQPVESPAWAAVATRPIATFVPFDSRQREAYDKLFRFPTFVPGSLFVTLRESALFDVIVGGDTKKMMSGLHSRK